MMKIYDENYEKYISKSNPVYKISPFHISLSFIQPFVREELTNIHTNFRIFYISEIEFQLLRKFLNVWEFMSISIVFKYNVLLAVVPPASFSEINCILS